ncbi:hypothetical protein [Halocalculus aciditolerans]|uniref:Uncharacterized protein n=1 Tax=Halocalculus aciditolerans TaxID=1383812 RepID=A0A830F285_9EURY|nr:hypothetical protein [Halocalculus aciditolerans]GGL55384.1 hypothetical protein GCM10009039_11890 [Halocalculus aciditolerans]
MAASKQSDGGRPPVSKLLKHNHIVVCAASRNGTTAHLRDHSDPDPDAVLCNLSIADATRAHAGRTDRPLCSNCARAKGLDAMTGRPIDIDRMDLDAVLLSTSRTGVVHRLHPDSTPEDPEAYCKGDHGAAASSWRVKAPEHTIFHDDCRFCFGGRP